MHSKCSQRFEGHFTISVVLQFNLHNKLNYVCMQDKEIMLHKKNVNKNFTGDID